MVTESARANFQGPGKSKIASRKKTLLIIELIQGRFEKMASTHSKRPKSSLQSWLPAVENIRIVQGSPNLTIVNIIFIIYFLSSLRDIFRFCGAH